MNPTSFKDYLITHLTIPEDTMPSLLENYTTKEVDREDYLLRSGEYCRYTFFVEKGLLRQYSLDEKGREHILMFAPENWFVADRDSIYFDRPSSYNVQALEKTRVALLNNDFFDNLSQEMPDFESYNNRLLHNHIRHLQARINMLLSNTAEERYLRFIEMYPDILLRVPQTMVASYLGITPESLSRVRRELARKNFEV